MARLATSKNLRIGCWTAAGCGIVASLVFFNCYPYSSLSFFPIEEFGKDILPYLVVAVGAALSRRLAPAAVSLVASFSILALGVFTHLDLMKYNYLNGWINDTSLMTVQWQWIIAVIAFGVATTWSLWRKFYDESKVR